MDKKTLEKELSKSFENVRADETNVVSCHGVRAVYKEAVHRDFESRHSGIQDEDRYWSNYKKSSEMLDEMYKSIRAEELCLGEAGPIIVFPEDLSKLEELEGSPWFLLGQLPMRWAISNALLMGPMKTTANCWVISGVVSKRRSA